MQVIDTTPPVIALRGNATVTVEAGSTYTDAGATAMDTVDGTVPVSTAAQVNTRPRTAPQRFVVVYTARDTAGNVATANRTVVVVDTTAPVITLASGATEVVEGRAGTYVDTGATAVDIVDGDVTARIVVRGSCVIVAL